MRRWSPGYKQRFLQEHETPEKARQGPLLRREGLCRCLITGVAAELSRLQKWTAGPGLSWWPHFPRGNRCCIPGR